MKFLWNFFITCTFSLFLLGCEDVGDEAADVTDAMGDLAEESADAVEDAAQDTADTLQDACEDAADAANLNC